MRPHSFTRAICTLVLFVSCIPVGAYAQNDTSCIDYVPPDARSNATELTLQGVSCFQAKDYARALKFYRAAFNITHDPLLEATIGRSMHELGMWSMARSYYKRYLKKSVGDKKGNKRIRERLTLLNNELRQKSALLKISSTPTRTFVYMEFPNGHRESLGTAPMSLKLAPKHYTIIFERRGYLPKRHHIALWPKSSMELDSEMVHQSSPVNISARELQRAGIITIGFALPVLIAGGVLANLGRHGTEQAQELAQGNLNATQEEQRQDLLANGYSMRNWGVGMSIIGSAALLTGAGVGIAGWMHRTHKNPKGRKKRKKRKNRAKLTPYFGIDHIGVSAQW